MTRSGPPVRPFRFSRATFVRHRDHQPARHLACPLCIRRATFQGLDVTWATPRAI